MPYAAPVMIADEGSRTSRRRIVDLAAFARETGSAICPIRVEDLSSDGCRITGNISFEQGTEIWLKIPGLTPRLARIAWATPRGAGCEFLAPIDPSILDEFVATRLENGNSIGR